jgi:2-oxoglutarate ferredoxin oxidoreductase subunit beta
VTNKFSDCGAIALILESLHLALTELELKPEEVVLVSGAEKITHAVETSDFLGKNFPGASYGCALSAATGIQVSNPRLSVIAVGFDDDMYGAGGSHFLQTIRRNPNVTHIVCHGIACSDKKAGVLSRSWGTGETMNPLTVALCCGASFVARGSVGEPAFTQTLMKRAISHQGYALLDIFSPEAGAGTVSDWLAKNTYRLEDNVDGERLIDHVEAMNLAFEAEPYPLGVLYDCKNLPTLDENLIPWRKDGRPLFQCAPPPEAVWEYMRNL